MFDLHKQSGHISLSVFDSNIIILEEKCTYSKISRASNFCGEIKKSFHHQISVIIVDPTFFKDGASRLSKIVFILKPLREECSHISNETKTLPGN